MPRVLIIAPDGTRSTVELSNEPLKFGRADSCHVILRDDGEVSREHAELHVDEHGRVVVTDHSKNGTRVDDGDFFRNAQRVASRTVRIGDHELRLLDSPPEPRGPVRFVDPAPRPADTQFFPSTRGLDLNEQRLTLLIRMTERIGGVFERKQLLEQALDACCESLGFERGLIALRTQRGDTEHPVTRNVPVDETGAYKISRTLVNRALLHGERAIVNNPATDLAGNMTESLVRYPICSALCVPILYQSEVLGVIYGDRVTQAHTYQPADVDFLAAIAQQVGVGLANLRLLQEHLRSQRMYVELNQAREIQRRLLPGGPLSHAGVTIEGYNEPTAAVGGDYFDYFEVAPGVLGLIIADVTGHGLPAALLMANVQSAIRVALSDNAPLTDLVSRINRLICRNTSSHVFVTAMIGRMQTQTGLLEYVSAGHPGPIVVRPGGVTVIEPDNGLPLGVDENERYELSHVPLRDEADAMLFYTDGLVEAANTEGALLGLDPVVQAMHSLRLTGPAALLRGARQTMRQFIGDAPRVDDMTLLAVERRAASGRG